MAIKNIKTLLTQATTFPAAVEAKLPAGAPKVSTMLLDAANMIPAIPDFPVEIPDLPAVPELPAMPAFPGAPAELARSYVSGVEVRPVSAPTSARALVTPLVQAYTQPIEGVVGQVQTRRGM